MRTYKIGLPTTLTQTGSSMIGLAYSSISAYSVLALDTNGL